MIVVRQMDLAQEEEARSLGANPLQVRGHVGGWVGGGAMARCHSKCVWCEQAARSLGANPLQVCTWGSRLPWPDVMQKQNKFVWWVAVACMSAQMHCQLAVHLDSLAADNYAAQQLQHITRHMLGLVDRAGMVSHTTVW